MAGKSLAGHGRTLRPLGVVVPGRLTGEGWAVGCECGWSTTSHTQTEAKRAYTRHRTSALPICSGCNKAHPREAMARQSRHLCKPCATAKVAAWKAENPERYAHAQRSSHLRKNYGMTIEQFDVMFQRQGGKCAICHEAPADPRGFKPHVDHCHTTGKVRGILCGRCNKALGQFKDDATLLRRAIHYLEGAA